MIGKAKKSTLFLMSIFFTCFIGIVSTISKLSFSKNDSLFLTEAHADYVPYTWSGGYGDCGGSGCGGCTSACGPSGY